MTIPLFVISLKDFSIPYVKENPKCQDIFFYNDQRLTAINAASDGFLARITTKFMERFIDAKNKKEIR